MPVSSEISTKKDKSQSQLLCDQMDSLLAKAQSQIKEFDKINADLEVESGLLQQALSLKLGAPEDLKQAADEMRNWKAEVKSDMKSAVTAKKNELKLARKARRQTLQEVQPEKAPTTRKKKKRGGFI
ncbi:hypothetical protein [Parendozoicomonas haliclonae]|uniref:Uncharacterized protein n=1 Tax=Parendozoicomonas haliclonae TaxID=1960125 RepID=A0A1X7AQS7_9GAMM|nr:hypothetical protein [Parendozoicomonas haliclonae]SMA50440.1 hypothetical protein EHSB41UT_04238 [Parendozoicomonas haliclonae]